MKDEGPDAFDTNIDNDEEFKRALTSHGRQGYRGGTSAGNRNISTAFKPQNDNRPTTGITGAGYQKSTLNLSKKNSNTIVEEGDEERMEEEKIREIERNISKMVDQSIICQSKGDSRRALEIAKSAARKERDVTKKRDASGLSDGQNMDLTFFRPFQRSRSVRNERSVL